ncbi:MAG: G-D-S-L family lipolytic protein, partial [Planctomycetota bacterium]
MLRTRKFLTACVALVALLGLANLSAVSVAQEKAHDAITPAPRDGNWMKRHESFNERVKKGNVDLLLIGDSITQGWEGSGKKVWEK